MVVVEVACQARTYLVTTTGDAFLLRLISKFRLGRRLTLRLSLLLLALALLIINTNTAAATVKK